MAICNKCDSILPPDSNTCIECGSIQYGEGSEIKLGSKTFRRVPPEILNPWEYYIKCMKKFLNFSGRASRSEFWSFMFFNILILILLSYSRNFLNTLSENLFFLSGRLGNFIYYLYFYDSLLVALSSGSRRMHDVGKTGFYILYPVYGLLLATTEGHRGSNDYGSNPLGGLELVEEIDWDSYSNGVKNGDL